MAVNTFRLSDLPLMTLLTVPNETLEDSLKRFLMPLYSLAGSCDSRTAKLCGDALINFVLWRKNL